MLPSDLGMWFGGARSSVPFLVKRNVDECPAWGVRDGKSVTCNCSVAFPLSCLNPRLGVAEFLSLFKINCYLLMESSSKHHRSLTAFGTKNMRSLILAVRDISFTEEVFVGEI